MGRRLSGRKAAAEEAMPPQEAVPAPVPVDMCVPPGVRALIITGPNTGGKTATIKVGAQRVCVRGHVYARTSSAHARGMRACAVSDETTISTTNSAE